MSTKDDWPTPQFLFDMLNDEFHFTLDVCANEYNYKCPNYFTKEQDGLSQPWTGTVWMNPPYGRGIDKWLRKAYLSKLEGTLCVCLIPSRTDTRWWHDYVMRASEIRFLTKRLKFEGAKHGAPFPSAIVVFDPKHIGGVKVRSFKI